MYKHYNLIPVTLISSSIRLKERDQLLVIHSKTIWRCMSKCRQPIRSPKHWECYHKTFTVLDTHKHCHLSMLSTPEWQPGICLEHTTTSRGKEDTRAALPTQPSSICALKQRFVWMQIGRGKPWILQQRLSKQWSSKTFSNSEEKLKCTGKCPCPRTPRESTT